MRTTSRTNDFVNPMTPAMAAGQIGSPFVPTRPASDPSVSG
jgi:hypothetical protein